jgi:PilZ domain
VTAPGLKCCIDEHRISPRNRTLKAGTIEFGGGAIDCVVRNQSETGAALEVASPLGIPEKFTLLLAADHSRHAWEVVRRKENRIGVRFG